ncbi:MAG: hypothetical protein WDN44_07460 [Sphingomonas sp.]
MLRLGGALRAPVATLPPDKLADYKTYDLWATPYPTAFQSQLATFVNLADSYQAQGAAANADGSLDATVNDDPDPLITPPLYGRWHALTERLLDARDGSPAPNRANWVHDLNLDPRFRVGRGVRHQGDPGQPGDLYAGRLGPDRRRARGQSADPPRPGRAGLGRQHARAQPRGRGRARSGAADPAPCPGGRARRLGRAHRQLPAAPEPDVGGADLERDAPRGAPRGARSRRSSRSPPPVRRRGSSRGPTPARSAPRRPRRRPRR